MMKTKILTTGIISVFFFALFSCSKFDDTSILDRLDKLENRVDHVEDALASINGDLSTLKDLYNALSKKLFVEEIKMQSDGFTIRFSDGTVTSIHNGKDGEDGEDGAPGQQGEPGQPGKDAPMINVKEDNGTLYWVQVIDGRTSWLLDDRGRKIPVSGKDAETPVIKVDSNGYWIISIDGGKNFKKILDEFGNPVKAAGPKGDSFFKSVEIIGHDLQIILSDGTIILLPIGEIVPYQAIDLGLSVKWCNMNVGAQSVEQAGKHYLWGDPYNVGINGMYTAPDRNNICGTNYDTAKHVLGGKWRMPSRAEQTELVLDCTWIRTTINGVEGMKVLGRNGNFIFLPQTGFGLPASGPYGVDNTDIIWPDTGYFWTGESYPDQYGRFAYLFYFNSETYRYDASWNTMAARVAIRAVHP